MKVAVVTGAGSGIGRATALRLARDGACLGLLDLREEAAQSVAREIRDLGGTAAGFVVDVADSQSVAAAFDRVRSDCGAVSILVNSAGIAGFVPVAQMTDEQWDRMIAIHLRGTFLTCRAAIRDMVAAGWGRIVNVASVAGLSAGRGIAHYSAAKAGIMGFTRALAQEVGPNGVTVNSVAPGMIDTPMLRGSGIPQELLDANAQRAPMQRIGTPDDIAAACAYLASEGAGFVTGQVLSPNGGVYM